MKTIITTLLFFSFSIQIISAQNPRDYISGFFQKINISAYQGGEFHLTVDVKTDTLSSRSGAYLFARVDDAQDNMMSYDGVHQAIQKNEWDTYAIHGEINKKGNAILVGSQCLFRGKFYFKNFSLKIKKKNGDWKSIALALEEFRINQENHPSQKFTNPTNCKFTVQDDTEDYLLLDASQIIYHGTNENAGKFVKVNGINLYYETYGEGEPLLLLHGNSQSIKDFAAQIPVLAKKYKVIAIDTRGHGQSTEDGTQLSYDLFADDMLALIDHLKLGKVNVLGWSDGGNTGLIMALKAPSRLNKLAIMGACLYNNKTSIKVEINKELEKRIKQLEKQNDEMTFQKRLMYLLRDEPNINPDDLAKITCPTLVMAGEDDLFYEEHTRLIAKKINKSQLIIFEGGNHEEPHNNPDRFNDAVLNFLMKEN